MKITKNISLILLLGLLVGCSSTKQASINSNIKNNKNKQKIIKALNQEKKSQKKIINLPLYELTENEKEFLEVLKIDKYASLCSSQDKYLSVKSMEDSQEKSNLLQEIFYDYTNNLNNSCIDQYSFKATLKENKFKRNKQSYEMYTQKLDRESLIKEFTSNKKSVKEILSKYTPDHPDFFKLIEKLDINKLSASKYNKLRLNVERLKLIKDYKSDNFIQLNVPSFNFSLYENGKKERSFETVVGATNAQTPIFSSNLSYFIVNPAWNIPDSIARKTIIPRALKDRNYLKRKNIVITKGYNVNSKIRFKDVNWKKYLKKKGYIPYKFVQLPSSTNGMGKVKYMFPNEHAVYMHDTIGSWRFKSNKDKVRLVSHGCVRLEHPISLMKHLTTKYTPKSYKDIRKSYLKSEMRTVSLSKKLPVHVTYQTAFIKKNGEVGFHKDVYGYDKIQKLDFIPYDSAVYLSNLEEEINSKSNFEPSNI